MDFKLRCFRFVMVAGMFLVFIARGSGAALSQVSDPPYTPVASYDIQVTLDPSTRQLSGQEIITYTNIQSEPITSLVFHLYLNAFRDANSLFLRTSGNQHRANAWNPDAPGWIRVDRITLGDGTLLDLELLEDGTLAQADLQNGLEQGESLEIQITFLAQLPQVFDRTGFAKTASGADFYMVGQWFPKLGVWQDGAWNAHPFHAHNEFYADFGDYTVSVNVPTGYVVGGTGTSQGSVERGDGTTSHHFEATRVIDFAWCASPDFKTASRLAGEAEVRYLYLPEHDWSVRRVLDVAEQAMERYGDWFGAYPYSGLTIVDVPDSGQGAGGMEYPTLITAGPMSFLGVSSNTTRNIDRTLELVVAHEIGHQWWQSTVATNEAEEPWLDEGFADYSTIRLAQALYGEGSALHAGNLAVSYLDLRRTEYLLMPQVAMYGPAWEFPSFEAYGIGTYSKPALALTTLERVLGTDGMLRVLQAYYSRFRFAHPTTQDFRKVAEATSGQDLSWFFNGVVYGDGSVNYRVVELRERGFSIERQGELALPVEILVEYNDGSWRLETWDGKSGGAVLEVEYQGSPTVRRVLIDPERKLLLDLAWFDNGRSRLADLNTWAGLFIRLVFTLQNWLLTVGGY